MENDCGCDEVRWEDLRPGDHYHHTGDHSEVYSQWVCVTRVLNWPRADSGKVILAFKFTNQTPAVYHTTNEDLPIFRFPA